MINALFSSKSNGTKSFTIDDTTFGWDSVVSLYERECTRVKEGKTRMVPKLKEVHIIRDSWTKLNVSPAKIMQVCTCSPFDPSSILLFFVARACSIRTVLVR